MKKKIEKNKETNESIESHEEKVLSEREKNASSTAQQVLTRKNRMKMQGTARVMERN